MKKNLNEVKSAVFAVEPTDPMEEFRALNEALIDSEFDRAWELADNSSVPASADLDAIDDDDLNEQPNNELFTGLFDHLQNAESSVNGYTSLTPEENLNSVSSPKPFAATFDEIRRKLANGELLETRPDGQVAFGSNSGSSSVGSNPNQSALNRSGNMDSISDSKPFAAENDNILHTAEPPTVSAPAFESTRTNLIFVDENRKAHPVSSVQQQGNVDSISSGHVFACLR